MGGVLGWRRAGPRPASLPASVPQQRGDQADAPGQDAGAGLPHLHVRGEGGRGAARLQRLPAAWATAGHGAIRPRHPSAPSSNADLAAASNTGGRPERPSPLRRKGEPKLSGSSCAQWAWGIGYEAPGEAGRRARFRSGATAASAASRMRSRGLRRRVLCSGLGKPALWGGGDGGFRSAGSPRLARRALLASTDMESSPPSVSTASGCGERGRHPRRQG